MIQSTIVKRSSLCFVFLLLISVGHAQFKLSITEFTLKNGLRVVLNRDTTFNEVALYLLGHAGFKKEQHGQYGMAHLFEHVMLPTRYYHNSELSRNAGRHNINGNAQVFHDYVRYYQHFDKNGIDYGMIALADRLDFQPDSLTEETLQRHIQNVNSEVSRSESVGSFRWRPVFRQELAKGIFGPNHPYGHEQSLTDITHATRKDVQNWFRRWYGARNATLLIIGNADPDSVRIKAETYFGHIDPGKQTLEVSTPVPKFNESRRASIQLNQDKHVIYTGWAVPGYGTKEDDALRLVTALISHPTEGLLTKALKEKGMVNAKPFSEIESSEDASVFDVGVEFTDWKDVDHLENIILSVVRQLSTQPVALKTLQAAVNRYKLAFIKSIEDIGMYDERVAELGKGALFINRPLYYETRLEYLTALTPDELRRIVLKWIANPPFIAAIQGQQLAAGKQPYDYKKSIPFIAPSKPALLPVFKKTVQRNVTAHGVKFNRIPVVNMLVTFENASNLSAQQMHHFKGSVSQFFEGDPAFPEHQLRGLQTEESVHGNNIIYKISVEKKDAQNVYKWLIKRLAQFRGIEKVTTAEFNQSPMENTLSQLKQTVLPRSGNFSTYPLSGIHFIVIGDADPEKYSWNEVKVEPSIFVSDAPASTLSTVEHTALFVKDIGESPTSFLTMGHFANPIDIKEEIYQQFILHLLRSRLMANLREKNSLVYEIYPYNTTSAGDQVLAFWQTSVPTEKTGRALEEIKNELEKLPNDLEKSVPSLKARVLAEIKQKFKSLNAIQNTVLESIVYKHKADYYNQILETLDTIEPKGFADYVREKAGPQHFKIMLFTTPKYINQLGSGDQVKIVRED